VSKQVVHIITTVLEVITVEEMLVGLGLLIAVVVNVAIF
jgi:hypothetical protein